MTIGAISLGDLATWLGSVGTVAALISAVAVALIQIKTQRRQHAVERTITAHKDITTGEAWAARDRLSEFMWRQGSLEGQNRCWQPTWEELAGTATSDVLPNARNLSRYPTDLQQAGGGGPTPYRDLYLILWQFERVSVAYHANLLDPELAATMLGSHVVWWDTFCERIGPESTRYREALSGLSTVFGTIDPSLRPWAASDFVST